jgi:hypothetical protein
LLTRLSSLRKDKKLLADLRRKLRVLWGNVEEKYRQETDQPLRQLTDPQTGGKNKRKWKEGKGGDPKKKPRNEEPNSNPVDSDYETAEEEHEEELGEAKFFEACLMEYGDSEGNRRFKIFGTIMP